MTTHSSKTCFLFLLAGLAAVLIVSRRLSADIAGAAAVAEEAGYGHDPVVTDALKKVLSDVHVNGFVFDVVLLYLTRRNNFRIEEVGVVWEERSGSKVDMLHTTVDMFVSVINLRIYYSPFKSLIPPLSKEKPRRVILAIPSPI